jgi:hypothetical protein
MSDLDIEILDPTAPSPYGAAQPTARLASLRGAVLGIRRDRVWQSFHHFSDRIAEVARSQWGVREVVFFDPGVRLGTTEEEQSKLRPFAEGVEAAIVGLGT